MTCKHNWVEINFDKKFVEERSYYYACTRCYQCRIAKLLPKENP